MRTYDLEDRLIRFSISIIQFSKFIPSSFEGEHLSKQLIRSSSSSALNCGEAMGSESDKDFIHKLSIVLKELRESLVCLKILEGCFSSELGSVIQPLKNENDQLVRIMNVSLKKVRKRNSTQNKMTQ